MSSNVWGTSGYDRQWHRVFMTSFLLDVHVFGSAHVCSGNSYQIMVYICTSTVALQCLHSTCTWYCIVVLTSLFFLPRYKQGDCFPTIHNSVWCAHHVDQDICALSSSVLSTTSAMHPILSHGQTSPPLSPLLLSSPLSLICRASRVE